jgi:hypothetical protein
MFFRKLQKQELSAISGSAYSSLTPTFSDGMLLLLLHVTVTAGNINHPEVRTLPGF